MEFMKKIFNRAPVFFIFLLLAAGGLLLYSDVITNGVFLFDDFEYIVGNTLIQNLSLFSNFNDPRHLGYASFALNYALDGEDPYGYHLLNVIIHIANAFLVFLLSGLILKILHFDEERINMRRAAAFFTSMLFLVHPVETQAVSYVTQRFTSLSAFFYLGSVLCYLAARIRIEEGRLTFREYGIYGLGVLSCILGMKTKEIAFTIPFMIAVLEYFLFPRPGLIMRRFVLLVPFMATLIIIPLSLLGPEWGIISRGSGIDEVTRIDKLYDLYERSTFDYLINQFRIIVTYIRLLIFPVNQLAVYDLKTSDTLLDLKVILSLCLLLSLVWFAVWCWLKSSRVSEAEAPVYKIVTIGIVWFFLAISIESSVIPIKDLIFEHRVYLPSIGIFLIVSTVLTKAVGRFSQKKYLSYGIIASMIIIVTALSAATYVRNAVWVDEVALWDDVVQKTGKAIGYNNRGNAYVKKGQLELAIRDLDKTVSFFPQVGDRMAWENSDFTPTNMSKTYMARGNIHAQIGNSIQAAADFEMARMVMHVP